MAQRRWRRTALLPAAMLGVPGVLLAVATPAHAAFRGGITSPGDGTSVTSHTTLTISSDVARDSVLDGGPNSTLAIRFPGESTARTLGQAGWSNNRQVMSFPFNTACPSYAGVSCDGTPAKNGSYQVVLTGSVNQTRNFTVRVAPAPPTNVRAQATGQREITVSWAANREPDLVSYDLYGGNGQLVAGDLPTHPTSYVVTLPSSGYGGDHSFAVRARRLACPGCADTLTSPLSAAATVTMSEPTPEPDPTPSEDPFGGGGDDGNGNGNGGNNGNGNGGDGDDFGSGTGGSGSGTGGSGSGTGGSGSGSGTGTGSNGGTTSGGNGDFSSGTTSPSKNAAAANALAQQRRSFGLTFKSFAPKLGAPKLPPLPQFAEPEEPDGTFDPTIDYGDEEVIELAGEPTGMQAMFEDVVSTVFEGRRFWTSLAAGFVLLLGAGHLRVWLGSPDRH